MNEWNPNGKENVLNYFLRQFEEVSKENTRLKETIAVQSKQIAEMQSKQKSGMKKTTYTTTRFDTGYDGFYVEVSPYYRGEEKWLEFVLCKEDYGFKNHMFGLMADRCPEDEWEDLIRGNLFSNGYIQSFYDDMEMFENALDDEGWTDK